MKLNAFLIIAHNNFSILEKILRLLDHEENDFYIHIDSKVKDFDENLFKKLCKLSSVTFVERINVTWGGYSLVECELLLLKAACKKQYSFYHLISGVDMPLKTNEEINTFLRNNIGYNYIGLDKHTENNQDHFIYDRVRYYYFMQEKIGSVITIKNLGYKLFDKVSVMLQKIIKIDRTKKIDYKLHKGAQWFSISQQMAEYIVSCESEIKNLCNYGFCVDEVFLQTIAYRSPYSDKIVNKTLRYIDWKRGQPYTFRNNDFNELISVGEDRLFARKFDEKIDAVIINRLYQHLLDQNKVNLAEVRLR